MLPLVMMNKKQCAEVRWKVNFKNANFKRKQPEIKQRSIFAEHHLSLLFFSIWRARMQREINNKSIFIFCDYYFSCCTMQMTPQLTVTEDSQSRTHSETNSRWFLVSKTIFHGHEKFFLLLYILYDIQMN